jgi:HSP20 family protein
VERESLAAMSIAKRRDSTWDLMSDDDFWDIDKSMNNMLKRINKLEKSLFSDDFKGKTKHSSNKENRLAVRNPKVDLKELQDKFQITAEMPGICKEDLKIDLDEDNRVLTLKGEHKEEKEEKGEKYYFRERKFGSFERSFQLPENIRMDQVKANMNNGLLCIEIPKTEPQKPKTRSIEIGEQH